VPVRTVASGPLAAALEVRIAFAGVRARLRLLLLAGERFVRCAIDLDNTARNRRLRLRLPAGVSTRTAVAGSGFGCVRRAVEPVRHSPMEAVVATAPAHRWVAAATARRGLAVFAPGFFEYEWTGPDLLVTLLRSVGELSRSDLATRPGHAGWATPTPEAQCPGADHIELAVGPCSAADLARPDRLEERWEDAFLPLRGSWLREAVGLAPAGGSMELDGDGLIVSAVKPAEDGDGAILRCWNSRDETVQGAWRVVPPPARAERTLADERRGTEARVGPDGAIAFRAAAGEIVTFRIR
jgi:alpha-mannosidase